MKAIFAESSRRVIPVLLTLAVAACFLLPFAGMGRSALVATGTPGLSSCPAGALADRSIVSYTGVALVAGNAPSAGALPGSCASAVVTPAILQRLRTGPLAGDIIGTLAIVLVILACVGFGRRPRVVGVAAAAAMLVLVVANALAADAIWTAIGHSGTTDPESTAAIYPGIGYVGALFGLGALALYVMATTVFDTCAARGPLPATVARVNLKSR